MLGLKVESINEQTSPPPCPPKRRFPVTAHDVHVSSHTPSEGDNAGRTIRPLDGPAILQLARRLVVFTPNGNQIASLMDLSLIHILTLPTILRV